MAVCVDFLSDLSYAAMTLRIVKSSLSMFKARHTGCSFAAVSGACVDKNIYTVTVRYGIMFCTVCGIQCLKDGSW